MDPLSITTGVLALLGVCISTGVALKEFYDGASTVKIKVKGLLTDVESFTQVLQLMRDTLEKENIQSSLQSTGHIGNHWNNLSTSILDGQSTLRQLQLTIEKANKSVGLFDSPRRQLRLNGAAEEIAVYQQQIRSYTDTFQLSLQTIILWNQVTVRESTDKILPNLDEIQQAIRRIALDFNDRISSLQKVIESKSNDSELNSLNNLRNCLKSAASVVSSASTTLGVANSARFSTYGSEFGDCFPPEPSEVMLRWISSNTVYEFEEEKDSTSPMSGPKPASGKNLELVEEGLESDQSDSDGELEAELIQSLLQKGKDKLASREFEDAERCFRNCLTRASSNESSVSLHGHVGPMPEIMTLLLTTYRYQEKWDDAHRLLIDKIAVESRGSPKANQGVLADMLILVEVLFKKSAYAEALLHGRRALKSYRKLGSDGTLGVQDSLRLLCQVCKAGGYHDEEDAYSAHLSYVLQQPMQKLSISHESEPTALPIVSTISSDQLTPSSATRTYQRGSSPSTLGSARLASPNTTYTSFSAASRESSSAVKESYLLDPADTYDPESTPLLDLTESSVPGSPPSSRLEGASEQLKVENDMLPPPTTKSTNVVSAAPETSQAGDTGYRREANATDSVSPVPLSPNTLLKRQKSAVPRSVVNHSQKNIEEAAIKKGNPPKTVIPTTLTPKVPIPVSDYELPQWIGTLQQDAIPAKLPKISLNQPEKLVQKSKSTTDLYGLGIVELPTELLQKSKSTINLYSYTTLADSFERPSPDKTTSAVNEDDWNAIYRPPNKPSTPSNRKPDGAENTSEVNGEDWITIFTTLDKILPIECSIGTIALSKEPHSREIASGTTPSQQERGTYLVDAETYTTDHVPEDVNKYVDPIMLKDLVEMGYPRGKALDALQKYDYDLERAADYLVTKSHEGSDPTGFQTKHTRSKSASLTSKEKHMGVQDFRFFVAPAPEIGQDSSVSTTNLETKSSFAPPRSVSFHPLVQLQNGRTSAGLYLDRPSPTSLTTRRSEPNMTEQARSITFSEILADRSAIRRKLVVVGDPFCGKSWLCSVFSKNAYPETYHSTAVETYIGHADVNEKRVELMLWDTGGDYNNSRIRQQCYRDSHIVLICFAINSPDSLDNAEEVFARELREAYNCSAWYMLVGLKGDLRYDWESTNRLKNTNQQLVTEDEARAVALRIGAVEYVECSAMTSKCVRDVFDVAARLALMPNEKGRKMRGFQRLFRKG